MFARCGRQPIMNTLADCSSNINEKDHLKSWLLSVYVWLCVRRWLGKPILALNCRLQIEHVNSDCAESDDDPLALDFLSVRFLSASQILFDSN